jgi:hypothetical protein
MGKPITHLHVPMIDAEDVVRHLGKKEKHWKAGRSAHALTNLWFDSKGLPKSVRSIFASHCVFQSAELVDAFLERQVDLGTPGRHSQTDILAIIALKDRLAIVAVEGKAGESFGEYVDQWLDGSNEKDVRITALCDRLGLSVEAAKPLRYQLLHRAASAIYEATRYRSKLAVMLIQSFARDDTSFVDFAKFIGAVGIKREIKSEQLL